MKRVIIDRARRLRARWGQFWFEPSAAANLGLCRVLFYGFVFYRFLRADYSLYGDVSPVFWNPYWLYHRVFAFAPPSAEVIGVVQALWKASLALACLGLLTRAATAVAFVLGLYLVGLPYNFGYTSHMNAAAVIILGIMALARCGDAWSLDRLLAGRLGTRQGATPRAAALSGEYTWPVRLVWVLLSLVFFAAGVSKLRHSGLGWMEPDTMAQFLLRTAYPLGRGSPAPLTSWGLWVAQYALLCQALAVATIVFEVGYPLALLGGRLRVLFAGSMVAMLVAVRLLLGPPFEMLMVCHLFWVRWDLVLAHVAARLRGRAPGRRPGRVPSPA